MFIVGKIYHVILRVDLMYLKTHLNILKIVLVTGSSLPSSNFVFLNKLEKNLATTLYPYQDK